MQQSNIIALGKTFSNRSSYLFNSVIIFVIRLFCDLFNLHMEQGVLAIDRVGTVDSIETPFTTKFLVVIYEITVAWKRSKITLAPYF